MLQNLWNWFTLIYGDLTQFILFMDIYIHFLDNFSRYTWLFPLKHKGEAV